MAAKTTIELQKKLWNLTKRDDCGCEWCQHMNENLMHGVTFKMILDIFKANDKKWRKRIERIKDEVRKEYEAVKEAAKIIGKRYRLLSIRDIINRIRYL